MSRHKQSPQGQAKRIADRAKRREERHRQRREERKRERIAIDKAKLASTSRSPKRAPAGELSLCAQSFFQASKRLNLQVAGICSIAKRAIQS